MGELPLRGTALEMRLQNHRKGLMKKKMPTPAKALRCDSKNILYKVLTLTKNVRHVDLFVGSKIQINIWK